MKNNMKIFNKIAVVLVVGLALSFTSCFQDLNLEPIDPNISQTFNKDAVFAKVYASMAITGMKGADGMPDINTEVIDEGTSSFFRMIWNLNELPTDEALCNWIDDPGVSDLNGNKWSSSNKMVAGMYARLTFNVTLCNHFLEETEGITDAETVRQRAEVKFIRALNYFYLMDFYGNPPFAEKVSAENPVQKSRAEVFEFIEQELLSIENEMFGVQEAPYYRADKAAAWLMLSRLYLNAEVYTGSARWTDAAIYAKKVIDSSYSLAKPFNHLFMGDNGKHDGTVNKAWQEVILPIAFDGIQTKSWGGALFLIASTRNADMGPSGTKASWGGNRARASLSKKFFPNGTIPAGADLTNLSKAANDDRGMLFAQDRTFEIATNRGIDFKLGLSVAKFTNLRADGAPNHDEEQVDMDVPFLRKGEAYLTYAEAVLRDNGAIQGGLSAKDAVNTLRERANASPFNIVDLDVVLDEWSREFYFEGRRRMDLIRYNRFGGSSYNWDWKGGTKEGNQFSRIYNIYPIPASDINANDNLKQNEGY